MNAIHLSDAAEAVASLRPMTATQKGERDAHESSEYASHVLLRPSLDRYRGSVRTMGDAIFLELREMIVSGVLPPNAPLRLHDLAERMQVSVQPIREAI